MYTSLLGSGRFDDMIAKTAKLFFLAVGYSDTKLEFQITMKKRFVSNLTLYYVLACNMLNASRMQEYFFTFNSPVFEQDCVTD